MIFKYAPTPRFFEEGFIRFTQPSALNDPDEARPELVIGKYAPEDYARAREEAKRRGMVPTSDEDLELFLRPFPRGGTMKRAFLVSGPNTSHVFAKSHSIRWTKPTVPSPNVQSSYGVSLPISCWAS